MASTAHIRVAEDTESSFFFFFYLEKEVNEQSFEEDPLRLDFLFGIATLPLQR